MKKRIAFIAFILILSIFSFTACDLVSGMLPQGKHEHSYENGKCTECGEAQQGYVPPHSHSFKEGKCECGETDPSYKPPHQHTFDKGVCTGCGSYDPNYVEHKHSFENGKCTGCGEADPDYVKPEEPEVPEVLDPTTVYLVGDSTVCSFTDSYYYPRYGYGTQLGGYLASEAKIENLALSGRSSRSFITEENYKKLSDNIGEGDYLIIGFGHNDEKSDDAQRFTDASKPYTEEGSFGYYLYNYYIKLALDNGATPILCTPVVRAKTNDDYSGNEGHVTANGDYPQAIRDLGAALGVAVVDLTAITKAEYSSKGYETAKLYHAVISGASTDDGVTVTPDWNSIDKTHLNIYGAKFVAYSLATQLKSIEGIGKYVKKDIAAPTEADLVVNPSYKWTSYKAPELDKYNAPEHFATISEGWYGTAFGDTGGNPQSSGNGYLATETAEGVFTVGNSEGKGKFSSSSDGFAFLFRQVEENKNFTISATATVKSAPTTETAGFGIMLRDDCTVTQNAKGTIDTNYVSAGVLTAKEGAACVIFSRENKSLTKGDSIAYPAVGGVYEMKIERIGQSVTVTVIFDGVTYTETYVDFDFLAVDSGYMYVGMFANRGTVVEFTNVSFEITGESQGA